MEKPNCEFCSVDSDTGKIGKGVHIVIERSFGKETKTSEIINYKFVITTSRKIVSENEIKLCNSCLYTFFCTSGLESETKMDSKFDGGNEMFETNFSVGEGMERELFFLDKKHLSRSNFKYGISLTGLV